MNISNKILNSIAALKFKISDSKLWDLLGTSLGIN